MINPCSELRMLKFQLFYYTTRLEDYFRKKAKINIFLKVGLDFHASIAFFQDRTWESRTNKESRPSNINTESCKRTHRKWDISR